MIALFEARMTVSAPLRSICTLPRTTRSPLGPADACTLSIVHQVPAANVMSSARPTRRCSTRPKDVPRVISSPVCVPRSRPPPRPQRRTPPVPHPIRPPKCASDHSEDQSDHKPDLRIPRVHLIFHTRPIQIIEGKAPVNPHIQPPVERQLRPDARPDERVVALKRETVLRFRMSDIQKRFEDQVPVRRSGNVLRRESERSPE